MKRQTKCYIYTRVSTAMQVDEYSLDAQKDKIRKYADYQDMEVVGEYSDEGLSGKNIKGRQSFSQMFRNIEAERITYNTFWFLNYRDSEGMRQMYSILCS